MKKLLIGVVLAFAGQFVVADMAKKETKQICVSVKQDGKDVTDVNTGKPKQTCRMVKQHQKLQGTRVPNKSAK